MFSNIMSSHHISLQIFNKLFSSSLIEEDEGHNETALLLNNIVGASIEIKSVNILGNHTLKL